MPTKIKYLRGCLFGVYAINVSKPNGKAIFSKDGNFADGTLYISETRNKDCKRHSCKDEKPLTHKKLKQHFPNFKPLPRRK